MDLRINNIRFIGIKPIQHNNNNNNTTIPLNTNLTVLPNYNAYMALSFGKTKPDFNAEAFMLPTGAKPDKYQLDAAISLQKGNNTIVTAPTGTGKTAIAHFIIKKNFEEGKRTFYTTPLKALSNQKYHDLKKLFGDENVGIMTGDRKENMQAPIIIMTTEIYRNMATSHYFNARNDQFNNLKTVIFDEFHYMGDPDRGSVWEESIMFTPPSTQILALSATVGNNKKISSWINSIKSKNAELIDVPASNRHVPLQFIMHNPETKTITQATYQANLNTKAMLKRYYDGKFNKSDKEVLNSLAQKMGLNNTARSRNQVIEIFRREFKNAIVPISEVQDFLSVKYNIPPKESQPLILQLTNKKDIPLTKQLGQIVGSHKISKPNPLNVIKIITQLKNEDKLPAIAFVFSKKYSEELLKTAVISGKDLTTKEEKKEILRYIELYKKDFEFYSTNLNVEALLKGYAIHSAAILPLQKQLIEELFNKKLIKVAFATETLAAGINMPARTVIMTDYQKPSGINNTSTDTTRSSEPSFLRPLSANEFHQMSGRAGRRGIDKIGYVVLLTDAPEKQAQFEKLIHSEPEPISSTLKIDAASVTGFFEQLENSEDMKRLLEISFSVYNASKQDKALKLNSHMSGFYDYRRLLEQYGFIEKTSGGHRTTEKGSLISAIKGKPQIPIVKAILDRRFENISPANLAATISAIAANQMHDSELYPILPNSTLQTETRLLDLNSAISSTLKNDFDFDETVLNAQNTNDEILTAIDKKYNDILKKDLDQIAKKRDAVLKLIYREEKLIKGNNSAFEEDRPLMKLKAYAKQLKYEQAILRRFYYIKRLLDERLCATLQKKNQAYSSSKNDIYNTLVADFSRYNSNIATIAPHIQKITMNPTALFLVGKWAELNAESSDYKSNWKSICSMLDEAGSIKYEGDLFNAIAQTIDFIHQLESVLIKATKMHCASAEEKAYYQDLLSKCKDAVKLIKRPPLYNSEEI